MNEFNALYWSLEQNLHVDRRKGGNKQQQEANLMDIPHAYNITLTPNCLFKPL
jgi:hypothetical protein